MTIPEVAYSQKNSTRNVCRSILNNEGKCWPEFNKYVKRHKGYRENIPAIKDCNGQPIIDPKEKANSLNYYLLLNTEYSTARVTSNIYSAPTEANPSPMIQKSLGKG